MRLHHILAILVIVLGLGFGHSLDAQTVGETRSSGGQFQYYDGSSWKSMNYGSNGSCSSSGQVQYNTSAKRLEYCNGSTWLSADSGANAGACASGDEGAVRRSPGGDTIQFCNGAQWRNSYMDPINGVCLNSTAAHNVCNAGIANDAAVADTSVYWRWRCDGQYNGTNSGTCQTGKDGTCINNSTQNACSTGTANDGAVADTSLYWRWRCDAAAGGTHSGTCQTARNGSCASTHYNCTTGNPNSGAYADTTAQWRWRCDAAASPGTNSGMCTETKAACSSSTTSYCVRSAGASGSTSGTCQYGGSCSYTCDNGSWTSGSNSCAAPITGVCAGTHYNCSVGTSNSGAYADTTAQWRWRCDSPNGGPNSGMCTQNKASCAGSTTSYCVRSTVASGSSSGTCQYGGSCSYSCNNGSWSLVSNTCTAAPVNGVCNNSVQNGCSAGTPNDGAIADTGTEWRWRCDGQNGGSNSGTCSKLKPINGSCSGTHYNCSAGTSNSGAYADTGTQWRWRCDGQNGGSNSGMCTETKPSGSCTWTQGVISIEDISCAGLPMCDGSASPSGSCASGTPTYYECDNISGVKCSVKEWDCLCTGPINGVCNNSIHNGCSAGTANDGAYADTGSEWRWRCDGQNGGSNSGMCSKTIPAVNGACGSAHGGTFVIKPSANLCSAGTASAVSGPTLNKWIWTCAGTNGGSTANCNANTAGGGGCSGSPSFEGSCVRKAGTNCDTVCCSGSHVTFNCGGLPVGSDQLCDTDCSGSSGGGGGGGCFVAGTQIMMADGSTKAIEDVRKGDMVMSFDKTKPYSKLEPRKVNETITFKDMETMLINGVIEVTPDHKFPLLDGTPSFAAGDLRIGDELIDANGNAVKVRSLQKKVRKTQVYNMEVDGLNAYVANGYRTGNMLLTPEGVAEYQSKYGVDVLFKN